MKILFIYYLTILPQLALLQLESLEARRKSADIMFFFNTVNGSVDCQNVPREFVRNLTKYQYDVFGIPRSIFR